MKQKKGGKVLKKNELKGIVEKNSSGPLSDPELFRARVVLERINLAAVLKPNENRSS